MRLTVPIVCLIYVTRDFINAAPSLDSEAAASRQIADWQKQYSEYIDATIQTRNSGCTKDNIVYRQEWRTMSEQARIDYTNAVRCLQAKPAVNSKSDVPGARSHYDDFCATHIIQANFVHFDGLFHVFHRYLVYLYEKTLQDECGYKGTQPYWDWTVDWQDPTKSPVFDGSPASMGSNGKVIPHDPINATAFGINLILQPGTGGGCVYSGPFSDNYTITLGPLSFEPKGPDNGLGYNPRCLSRDLNLYWSNQTRPTAVTSIIGGNTDMTGFGTQMEVVSGIHAGGHLQTGGMADDPIASCVDPIFYLHHAMIDRVWTIWQNIENQANRTQQTYLTQTQHNDPPSPNSTLDTAVNFGVLAPTQRYGDLVSSIDGPFCYAYV